MQIVFRFQFPGLVLLLNRHFSNPIWFTRLYSFRDVYDILKIELLMKSINKRTLAQQLRMGQGLLNIKWIVNFRQFNGLYDLTT